MLRVRHFVVVIHHNVVDGRPHFLKNFSGLVNRDLVLLGRFRCLGQIRYLDGVIHLHDVLDDLAASINDFAVTWDQLLEKLLHQIQRCDHFERVRLGVLLRNLAGSPVGLPAGS